MRKRIAAAALGLAMLGAPAAAHGAPDSAELKSYELRYLKLRHQYVEAFGLRAAGRNIVIYGYRQRDGRVRPATRAEVLRDVRSMAVALQPPAAETAASPPASTYAYSGGAASSATAQCESGGDYTAVNPAGYYGAYQFDQQTWNAYAPSGYVGVNPAAAPPAVQDATAASVPYDAWPNC